MKPSRLAPALLAGIEHALQRGAQALDALRRRAMALDLVEQPVRFAGGVGHGVAPASRGPSRRALFALPVATLAATLPAPVMASPNEVRCAAGLDPIPDAEIEALLRDLAAFRERSRLRDQRIDALKRDIERLAADVQARFAANRSSA